MEKDLLVIPMGASEIIDSKRFMVARNLLDHEPKKDHQINIMFSNGFIYNGEIYHKNNTHLYVCIY